MSAAPGEHDDYISFDAQGRAVQIG
jgi:hypothetical protein